MCGIAGRFADGGHEKRTDLMLAMLAHRGPDEFGTYIDRDISMGTARLAIIDIEHGQQPMRDEETGVVIAYNGEVFNYRELRADQLDGDANLQTQSDTEVILRLYLKYGERFIENLNGQFAIAIWDPRIETLILARDRFGICPLFYYHADDTFAFASEIKALFTLPQIPRQIEPRALDQIFSFWVPVPGTTAFTSICELPPAHTLIVQKGAAPRLQQYYDWKFPGLHDESTLEFSEAQEALRESLSTAVTLRLRADIEVGSYLSGGIDSSAIAALASQLQPSGLRTYSVAFKDSTYDESEYQDRVAAHCGTHHRRLMCDYQDISGHFERAVWHAEAPLFRTAPTPLNLLSRFVRDDGLKVVLSGEGADEVLLGYDLFREVKIRRFCQRAPESDVRPQLFKKLYAYLPQFSNPRYANIAIQSFKSSLVSDSPFYSHLLRWANNAANKVYFSPDLKVELQGYDCTADLQATLPADFFSAGEIDRAQYLELTTLLRGYLLASQGDRMTMGNSIEGRYPFLDHEFVALANSLPRKYMIPGLKDKWVFREAFRDLLPDDICHRPKFAYQAPEIRAFCFLDGTQSPLIDKYMNVNAIRDAGFFKASLVAALFKKIAASDLARLGTRDNMALIQMLSTQMLHDQFVRTDLKAIAEKRLGSLFFKTRIRMGEIQCTTTKL